MTDKYKYLSLNILNDRYNNPQNEILRFQQTRNAPIISDISQYKMSVIRFSINDTSLIPVFIPEIDIAAASVHHTIYKITMAYGATNYTMQCLFFNSNATLQPPSSMPATRQDAFTNPYYFVYSLEDVRQFLQNNLTAAFNGLKALTTPTLDAIPEPIVEYDFTSQLFRISFPKEFTQVVSPLTNPIDVYFNYNLHSLFSGFPVFKTGLNTPRDYQLNIQDTGLNNLTVQIGASTYTFYLYYQETSSLQNISPVENIVITSNNIPIVAEDTNGTAIISDSGIVSANAEQSLNIISDFQTDTGTYSSGILYLPEAEYRYTSLLNARQPLKTIDFSFFWRSRFNQLNEVYLPPGGTASIKILFERLD